MDPSPLITFLAPCLGFLLKAGTAATEHAAATLGEQVWEHARRLWARLGPAVEARPAAAEAAGDLAERPDDERARGALAWQLEKAFEAEPSLAADLRRLWADGPGAVLAAGERSVAVGGDIVGSSVVTGDRNVVGRHS